MIVASVLVITGLLSSARGSPMSYATYRRREMPVDERPELLLLYDQRGLENTDPPLRSANDVDRSDVDLRDDASMMMSRSKKLRMSRTSLSIVNPLDVLRDRVMLELARRKAMQDQRQIDANRRILEEIGKRSAVPAIDRSYAPRSSIYDHQSEINQENNPNNSMHHTQRIPVDYYNVDDNVIRSSSSSSGSSSNGDDETRKESNYHHDRI